MRLTAAALALAFLAAPAAGDEIHCRGNDDYFVVVAPQPELDAERVLVGRRAGPDAPFACTFAKSEAILIVDGRDRMTFEALSGHHLVLREPAGSNHAVLVYDLRSRRKVFDRAVEDSFLSNEGVHYFEEIGDASPAACEHDPDVASMAGAVLAEERTFRFESNRIEPGHVRRCFGRQ